MHVVFPDQRYMGNADYTQRFEDAKNDIYRNIQNHFQCQKTSFTHLQVVLKLYEFFSSIFQRLLVT